ncbi:MAG: DUF881 domain-containing protein [Eubacteriales bacterium]
MKKDTIIIFVICVAVGFLIAISAKLTNGQHLFVSPNVINDLKTTIESENQESKSVLELIAKDKDELKKLQGKSTSDSSFKAQLSKEVENYKTISGAYDLRGEGVTVTIDDGTRPLLEGEDPNNVLVHDADLLSILNELKTAGAEAISVNGQRLVNTSEIACSGYSVRINNQFFARPFIISAIGDSKRMAAVMVAPESYGNLLKEYGLTFEVKISDDVLIKKYTETFTNKYMVKK